MECRILKKADHTIGSGNGFEKEILQRIKQNILYYFKAIGVVRNYPHSGLAYSVI